MGNGAGQFDVPHALSAHLGQSHLDTTFFADDTTVLEPLVFSAQALVVTDRAKQLGAEKAVPFGLESPVVDGFRLFDFPP